MSQVKPVVSFRTGSVPEAVAKSETGTLVELDNESELANALVRLSDYRELGQRMGCRGFERTLTIFIAQHLIEETVDSTRRVISHSRNGFTHDTR